MFSTIKRRWKEARGEELKKELNDAITRLDSLPEEVNSRAMNTLATSYRYLTTEAGPFENVANEGKMNLSKMLSSKARKEFKMNLGRGYGLALLSMHLESSCLPGEDAKFVHDSTAHFLAIALDAEEELNEELGGNTNV